ncbi:hypothetical protein [Alteromonas sp. M12]|uniref:hypothetical protein n=1 Tax=Alteromonas sp. M12 TaxID=3135644 RepID=UPI00319E0ED2
MKRINAAKALGYTGVEMWNPVQTKCGKKPELIVQRAKEQGMGITSYSPSAPNLADSKNE